MSIGIYKITNQLNGKIYVGQSIHIHKRWTEHKRKYKDLNLNNHLYQAMREYGVENFIFEIIEECPEELLNEREIYWINKLDSLNNGYNMSLIENTQNKVPAIIAKQVQQELINSELKCTELAKKYEVSHTWISLVNQGKLWHDKNLIYPLRPFISNIKKEYYCSDCGCPISKGAKRCISCAQKLNNGLSKINKISREEFKNMIRTMPFTEVGKILDIGDGTVRQWCKKFNLPFRKREINAYSDEEWSKI